MPHTYTQRPTPNPAGIVYELFVNGKRFEDLTQALPSPVRTTPIP